MDFFRNALGSTPEQLKNRLSSPIFEEAIGVLEMISKTPDQRRRYDARLKWELDENTRIAAAKAEGRLEGKLEGKVDVIHLLQRLLGEQPANAESLQAMSGKALDELIAGLETKLRSRST